MKHAQLVLYLGIASASAGFIWAGFSKPDWGKYPSAVLVGLGIAAIFIGSCEIAVRR